ncbi:MAG: hypothetical protein ACRCSL_04770 [Microbacterium sp.]
MAQNSITPAQIPPGEILTYYGDLASGAIRPEDVRIDALTFRAIIDRNGNVTFQSPKITVISRYNFAIRRIFGAVLDAPNAGFAAGLIRFNVQEQGRSFFVFKNPVTLSGVTNGGSAVPYEWDGVYICVPGTDLEVTWSVDAALWQTLVGAPRVVEIVLTGDYIACGPQGR